jgi:hypothetical protein
MMAALAHAGPGFSSLAPRRYSVVPAPELLPYAGRGATAYGSTSSLSATPTTTRREETGGVCHHSGGGGDARRMWLLELRHQLRDRIWPNRCLHGRVPVDDAYPDEQHVRSQRHPCSPAGPVFG